MGRVQRTSRGRRGLQSVVVAGVVTAIVMLSTAGLAGEDPPLRLGIPAYGYPGLTDMWAQFVELPAGSIVILDPANGPGAAIDAVYEKAVASVSAAGVNVYGYVDTDYGKRSTEDMLVDLRRHQAWYSVVGVFLDQTPGPFEPRIAAVMSAAEADGLRIAVNPGQPVIDREWVALSDHVVTFEGDVALYEKTTMPRWMWEFSADKYWHLVYGVSDGRQVQRLLRRAAAQHAGYVYITDGVMPNPWLQLPAYWPLELSRFPAAPAFSDVFPRR